MSPDEGRPEAAGTPPPPPSPDSASPGSSPPPAGGDSPKKPAVVFHKKSEMVEAWSRSLSKLAGQSRIRGARAQAGEKKFSVGDQLQKTARPPSKFLRVLKGVLLLIVVVGIPLIIGASFLVKVGEKKKRSVAELFWIRFKRLIGWGPGGPSAPPLVQHPNVDTYLDILKAQERDKTEIGAIAASLSKRDEKTPWDREETLRLHERLDQIHGLLVRRMEALGQIGQWLQEYAKLAERATEIFDRGIAKDPRKEACAHHLLRGEAVPPDMAEAARDPAVLEYVEVCRKMELDRYHKVTLSESEVDSTLRAVQALIGQIRTVRAGLPSRMALGAGPTEGPSAEAPPRKPPAYHPRAFHSWARAPAGTWVRYRVSMADGTVFYEDRIVKEVREASVVFSGQRASGGQVTDEPEREEKFLPGEYKELGEETLRVGDLEIPCLVIQVGEEKRWVARSGRWANRVVLKTEKGGVESVVTGLREEVLPFKDRQYNCIAFQIGEVRFWAHEDVPGFVFRLQNDSMTREVVDFGGSLEARPPFPAPSPKAEEKPEAVPAEPSKEGPKPPPSMEEPGKGAPQPQAPREEPKPEPPREEPKSEPPREESKKEPAPSDDPALAEANRLVNEAGMLFRRVSEGMKDLPEDPETLRTLLRNQEEVQSLYLRAREIYVAARSKAPPEAGLEERIEKIDLILSLLQKYGEAIKSKLK